MKNNDCYIFLDATDLLCPMPILKAKKALKQMAIGEILKIKTTDPQAIGDFKAFVKQTGHKLLDINIKDQTVQFLIQKG